MSARKYKAITFADNYTGTYDQFKAEFENTWVFLKMEKKEREKELKKAFNIAINKQ